MYKYKSIFEKIALFFFLLIFFNVIDSSKIIKNQSNKCEESIRRTITMFLQDDDV